METVIDGVKSDDDQPQTPSTGVSINEIRTLYDHF